MKLSVIIPCFNSSKTIASSVDSILKQTYQDYEVIIVNDGSTDESEKVISSYLDDKRIKLYNKENGGLASAISYGSKKATGDYVLYLDADDTYVENLFSTLVEEVEDFDALSFGYKTVNEKGKEINIYSTSKREYEKGDMNFLLSHYYTDENRFTAFRYISVHRWAMMYKKEIVDKMIDIYQEENFSLYEDYLFVSAALAECSKVKNIPFIGVYYLQVTGSKSHSHVNQKEYEDLLQLRKRLRDYMDNYAKRNNLDKEIFSTMEFDVSKFYLSRFIKRHTFKESSLFFKRLKKDSIYEESKNKVNLKDESMKRKIYYFFLKHNMFLPIFLAFKLFDF